VHRPESRAVIGVPALSVLAMRPDLVQRFRAIEEGSGQRLAFIVASTLRPMAHARTLGMRSATTGVDASPAPPGHQHSPLAYAASENPTCSQLSPIVGLLAHLWAPRMRERATDAADRREPCTVSVTVAAPRSSVLMRCFPPR
jgi:hypothetical protein